MTGMTDKSGVDKKNSIDEFVEGAKTSVGEVVQDVKDYTGRIAQPVSDFVGEITKPVTDFVAEVGESETYAGIKIKAAEIGGAVKEAVNTYGPYVIPAAKIIGDRVGAAAKGIVDDISELIPNRATDDAARLGLTGFDARGYLLEYDAARGYLAAGDKREAATHLSAARAIIENYRVETMGSSLHTEEEFLYLNTLDRSIKTLDNQIYG